LNLIETLKDEFARRGVWLTVTTAPKPSADGDGR
jgi:hypothetical protein